jgi:hypothetical protein
MKGFFGLPQNDKSEGYCSWYSLENTNKFNFKIQVCKN